METDAAARFRRAIRIPPGPHVPPASPAAPGQVHLRYRLPPPARTPGCSVEAAISGRATNRSFDAAAYLSLPALSTLLVYSCGRVGFGGADIDRGVAYRRATPSAGATYGVSAGVVALRVSDLPAGVFEYDVPTHELELVRFGQFGHVLGAWALNQPHLADAAAVVVLIGTPDRIVQRYGPRGWSYLLFEAGHIAQNLCLLATSHGLGTQTCGGFYDEALEALFGLDGRHRQVVYLVAVGWPRAPGPAHPL